MLINHYQLHLKPLQYDFAHLNPKFLYFYLGFAFNVSTIHCNQLSLDDHFEMFVFLDFQN